MGFRRHGPAAVRFGRKVYVFGGTCHDYPQATFESFDLDTGGWCLEGQMPEERVYSGAAACDGRIYVIGGVDANGRCRDTVPAGCTLARAHARARDTRCTNARGGRVVGWVARKGQESDLTSSGLEL